MEKAVKVLKIISNIAGTIASIGLLLILISAVNKSEKYLFIGQWLLLFFAIFTFPAFMQYILRFYPAKIRPKTIEPRKWLMIGGIATLVYLFVLFVVIPNNYAIKCFMDLPLAICDNYSIAEGVPQKIPRSNVHVVNGVELSVDFSTFDSFKENDNYQFFYLPNSKYLIDIKDENGKSLLR